VTDFFAIRPSRYVMRYVDPVDHGAWNSGRETENVDDGTESVLRQVPECQLHVVGDHRPFSP